MAADYLPYLYLGLSWGAGISALVSALRARPDQWVLSGQSRGLALLGLLLTCGLGGVYYWVRVKPRLKQVSHLTLPPTPAQRRETSPWDDGLG